MRTISSTATTISFRSGLWLLDGTGRRRPWFLPDSRIGHRRPGFGGFEMPVLQQFDRNAVGRADEGHMPVARRAVDGHASVHQSLRSEEHTSELQSLMRISYAVFCLKKKNHKHKRSHQHLVHR